MGKQWKQWQTLFWGGSKITADGDCSHEIKRRLLLGRKAMTNLDSILKSRGITLLTKVRIVKAGFSSSHVWMWKLVHKETWVQKNWWFWTVLLKTLESPWTSKKSIQSIPKEISPEYSLEELMLKLKLQYFGYLVQRTDSLKRPWHWKDWRKEEQRATEDEMVGWHHWLNGHELSKPQELVMDR